MNENEKLVQSGIIDTLAAKNTELDSLSPFAS